MSFGIVVDVVAVVVHVGVFGAVIIVVVVVVVVGLVVIGFVVVVVVGDEESPETMMQSPPSSHWLAKEERVSSDISRVGNAGDALRIGGGRLASISSLCPCTFLPLGLLRLGSCCIRNSVVLDLARLAPFFSMHFRRSRFGLF